MKACTLHKRSRIGGVRGSSSSLSDCCSTTGVFAIKLTSTAAPYGFLKMSMRSSCMTL
jgi:hypothetical protein